MLRSHPCPIVPIFKMSMAKTGIKYMYEMPKKLLKKVITIKNGKGEFLRIKFKPSNISLAGLILVVAGEGIGASR